MKKLPSLALYALVTPVITLGAAAVLAQSSADTAIERGQPSTQQEQGATQSTPRTTNQSKQDAERAKPYGSPMAAEHRNMGDQRPMQNRGYLTAAPPHGLQASNLIGTEVKTTGDEEVGSVSDLIIDENGRVVAIVVGVGGFLGLGERDVAIGWDDVTKSGSSADQHLRIDATREELSAAPAYIRAD